MKSLLATAILTVPMLVMAQQPQAPAQPAATTNLVEHAQAPTYTDIYCSGFVTKENIPTTNHIVAGMGSPHSVRFVARQTVYLAGPGYAVGNRYSVIRKVKDPNLYEMAPGQNALLKKSGNEYAELGQVTITYIDREVAVGEVDFSCSAMAPGDTLLPFHEKEMVKFSARPKFQVFAPYGGTAGRIIDGKEFDKILGTGQKVYVNVGANQGVHPGDYLRITRNYNPSEMAPVDRYSLDSPYVMDEAQDAVKLTKSDYKKLPARGIGEMVVLSVTPETATGMITLALEDVTVGDVVEVQGKQ
ncbi:MAG TPA: hypothetical protein VF135_11670 [Terriglobales bacterium]